MKIFRWIMIAAGLFLVADTAVVSMYSNFTVGLLLSLILGGVLLLWGIFYKAVRRFTEKGFMKVLRIAAAGGIIASAVFCVFLMIYGSADTVTYDEDAVIVLGCAVNGSTPTQPLAARLDTAVEYHEKNPEAYLIVSGGQGFQEDITEAECMENYLLRCGVRADRIIREPKATSTNENIAYSKEIMNEYPKIENVALITNDFHVFRAKQLAKINGIEVASMHAVTPWYNASMMYLREILAVGQLIIFKK